MLFKLLAIFLIQVWDFHICGYTFVAGRSNRVNTFKNFAGESHDCLMTFSRLDHNLPMTGSWLAYYWPMTRS